MNRRIALASGALVLTLVAVAALRGLTARDADASEARARAFAAPAEPMATPTAPGSTTPNLALAPDGSVYMSWLEAQAEGGHALRFARWDGRVWSPARTIVASREFFVNWADFASIEPLPGNRLAAHWLQRVGAGTYAYGVRVAVSNDGGRTWSAPMTPHRDTSHTEHGFVSLWRDGRDVGATWLDGRRYDKSSGTATDEMMLMATTIDARARAAAEFRLDERVCDCCQTATAITADGPIVAYRDRTTDEIRDIYVARRVRGRWMEGRTVHADGWRINACPVNGPAIVADGRRVAIAWFTGANSQARVNVAFSSDAGATFGAPVRVDEGSPAGRVDIVLDGDGALVSWVERTGGDTAAVRVRRVAGNGRAAEPLTVTTSSAARASGFPRMVRRGNDAIFAWTVPGTPSHVRLARLRVE